MLKSDMSPRLWIINAFSDTCPDDFVHFQQKCYKFSTEKKSWSDARAACQAIGEYDLAIVDNAELATYFAQKVDSWIGLNDLETEGTYTWVNGAGLEFGSTFGEDPWGQREPNVRTCLYIHHWLTSLIILLSSWTFLEIILYLYFHFMISKNHGGRDGNEGEDCVHTNANGMWNDNQCSHEMKYICGPVVHLA